MENAFELFSSDTSVAPKAEPRLNLLVEREPAHRVFFSNLFHAFEPVSASLRTSSPGDLWHDVFLPTSLPWKSFQESLLWHFVVIFAGWALTQGWASRPQPHVRETYRTSGSIYYSPSKIFPSARSSPPKAKPQSQTKSQTASRAHGSGAMPVAAESRGTPKLVVPPDLKLAEGPRAPNLASSNPTMPSVPLSATSRSQSPLGALNSAVAPPPEVSGRAHPLSGLPQAAALAPPADLAGMGGRRTLRGPGASVVQPPPSIQGTGRTVGSLGAAGQIVAPPPQLPGEGLRAGLGRGPRALASGSAGVVPPPPSVEHSGRAGSMPGPGVAVVPPPPAVQAAGLGGGLGRVASPGGVGPQVVPPPPSVQNGGGVLGALSSFFSGGASKVVPPQPAVQGSGIGAGDGSRMGSLGGGSAVVPPPPAMQAGGGNGKGRITSLGSGGSEIVPPPPTMSGAGGASSGRGGLGGALSGGGSAVVAPPPSLAGMGSGSGKGPGGNGRAGLSSGGADVVAPPPTIQGGSGTGGGGNSRFGPLAGAGTQVVPPPPGLQGTGNGNRGHGGALLAGGGNVVAPPPSMGDGVGTGGNGTGGNGAGGNGSGRSGRAGDLPGGNLGAGGPPAGSGSVSTGPLEQMEPLPGAGQPQSSPPPTTNPSGEDVPLRLVGVAVASSKTSFFSNYEVFIAERRLSPGQTELIKLVFVFLPYQKRLSEYDLSTTKIYKLRATRDPRCDETLMQMSWPEGEQPDEDAANRLAGNASNKNSKLPCYNTTADDFQKAIAH